MRSNHIIALLVVLVGLWGLDRSLAPRGDRGSEYGTIQKQARRLETKPDASILVLGQSTTGRWLTPRNLGRLLKKPQAKILDAHLSGCHPDCSYAEVRNLLAQGRHFDEVYFGVNLFTLCEGESRRRVAAELLTLPVEDTFAMARHYFAAQEPTRYFGALAALTVSHAYWDPAYVQRRLSGGWGLPKKARDWWMSQRDVDLVSSDQRVPKSKKPNQDRSCAVDEEPRVAFKMSVLEALMKDLGRLADHTYLMALPDRTLTARRSNREMQKRWDTFTRLLRDVAQSEPTVEFVDLASHGPPHPSHYRDSFHLSALGIKYQNRQLSHYLRKKAKRK